MFFCRFKVLVKFSIPNIVMEPGLESIQTAISEVAHSILNVCEGK